MLAQVLPKCPLPEMIPQHADDTVARNMIRRQQLLIDPRTADCQVQCHDDMHIFCIRNDRPYEAMISDASAV